MPEQESREISFEVGPDSLAPREARHRVADELVDVAGIDAETAELLVSELVTNVVRHAGTPAHVRLVIDVDCVRVEVADGSPARPKVQPLRRRAVTGRGMRIVDGLAARWGTDTVSTGSLDARYRKVVWFELDRNDRS